VSFSFPFGCFERGEWMGSSSKRRQTMAKVARERALQERRERKQQKKDERKQAAAEQEPKAVEPTDRDQ
jgi:predicted Fe-S protein YdhL (DUF1289 family)